MAVSTCTIWSYQTILTTTDPTNTAAVGSTSINTTYTLSTDGPFSETLTALLGTTFNITVPILLTPTPITVTSTIPLSSQTSGSSPTSLSPTSTTTTTASTSTSVSTESADTPGSIPSSSPIVTPVSTPVETTVVTDQTTIFASATDTSSQQPVQSDVEQDLTPIVVTGIGVGAGVGGALLSLLGLGLAVFVYRRRRRQKPFRPWNEDGGADILSVSTEMGPIALSQVDRKASTIEQPSNAGMGIDLLPVLTDMQIASHLFDLKRIINFHVDRYYNTTTGAASPNPRNHDTSFQTLCSVLEREAPLDAGAWNALLQKPRTRMAAIRMIIAWIILHNIAFDAPLDRTLLPPELVRLLENTEPPDTQTNDENCVHLSKTRHLTASLLASLYSTPSLTLDVRDPRKPNIADLTATLHQILQPHTIGGFGAKRVKDLESVIAQGAMFGYTLFSQPTAWRFDWKGDGVMKELAVFPALVKVGDEKGVRLGREVVVSKAEAMNVVR